MKWHRLTLGGGSVRQEGDAIHLTIPAKSRGYADAQIDDTQSQPRSLFRWKPPVLMKLKARATPGRPLGTLGFGFWNDPFSISLGMRGAARRLPVPPQALWFFYGSPPNDIRLTKDGDGSGWKAMSIHSPRLPGTLTLMPAVVGIGLAQLRLFRRIIMSMALRVIKVHETQLQYNLDEWHSYEITWKSQCASFTVDGTPVLVADLPPKAPLGFVAWIDNQYAVASPQGGFRFGFIPTEGIQTLELLDLQLVAMRQ